CAGDLPPRCVQGECFQCVSVHRQLGRLCVEKLSRLLQSEFGSLCEPVIRLRPASTEIPANYVKTMAALILFQIPIAELIAHCGFEIFIPTALRFQNDSDNVEWVATVRAAYGVDVDVGKLAFSDFYFSV